MTKNRTCEFEHNHPKKSKSTEDGFSGLPFSEDKDGLTEVSCYGDKDDKGGVLEDGFSGLRCYGEEDVKGGILEDGFSGLCSFGDGEVKGGILKDGFSELPSSVKKDELSGLSFTGEKNDKVGILEDGFSGLCSFGDGEVKGGILEDGFSGLPPSVKEDGLSGLSFSGEKMDKVGILGDGFSGLCSSGDELCCDGGKYVKGGVLEDGLSGLSFSGEKNDKVGILGDGFSGLYSSGDELCCYGGKYVKGGVLEDGFAEKVKKGERKCELRDPLVVLGSDIMLLILSCLDAQSVALCLIVSSGWYAVASSDEIWSSKLCKWLLHRASANLKTACLVLYSAAPEYWRRLDPFWNGTGPLMRRYFHQDGSHTADPDDKVWGGHECCYTVVTGLLADGKIREHYVRINRLPPMHVKKKEDWSWELSNYLCTYRSLPDAHKEDGTGPLLALH